jgi:hypothetical protein
MTLEASLTSSRRSADLPDLEGTVEIQRLVISRAISGSRGTIKLRN